LIAHPSLAGVCALAGDAHATRAVVRALAERAGAILPLIQAGEVRRAGMLWRFCAEQTLTINTAAAGGNAELLAGGARRLDAATAAA
jgi:RHH-type proline utilization regulon transcriptional repressor/proline dehydrogenase/delta 1-pyrroline-5-carboxylate dehydrogenase